MCLMEKERISFQVVWQYLMHCLAKDREVMPCSGVGGMLLNFDLAHLTSMQGKWVTKYSQLSLSDSASLWLNAAAILWKWWGLDCVESKRSLKYIQSTAALWWGMGKTPGVRRMVMSPPQPHLPLLWRSNPPLTFAGLTYHVSKYLKIINQTNKLLSKICSVLPWQS